MVIKNDANINSFLLEIKTKKLYCYGAGDVFRDFLLLYPDINIYSVIDNRAETLKNEIPDIDFIKPEKFLHECDAQNSVLLITCLDYSEIQNELQKEDIIRNLSCYVYYIMQEWNGVEEHKSETYRYQLTEFRFQDYMARQKAPADVTAIASKFGYRAVTLNRGTIKGGLKQTEQSWSDIVKDLKDDSILLIQLPLIDVTEGIYKLLKVKKEKNVKIIAVIHDVDVLRGNPTVNDYKQYEVLKELPDILIVHNKYMMAALSQKGFDFYKMVNLEIFDYLISDYEKMQESDGVIIAGNLIKTKAAYVYQINKIKDITFNLFGANYNEKQKYSNINYFGAFLPDELTKNLAGKYGLVWDGDSIDTCGSGKGEYLRINNPHKLSLYLAVGLPVIIWDEAAESEFVKRENVGLTISSLYELPDKLTGISDRDYAIMKANAAKIGKRLRNGEYMTRALKAAEAKIKKMRENE